jgi:hypothetical protein
MAQQEDLGLLHRIRTSQQNQPTDQATSHQVPKAQSHQVIVSAAPPA